MVLISKDENLTKSHARYVEACLIRSAGSNPRWTLPNTRMPSNDAGKLPLPDRAAMDEFVDQTKTLVGALGWDLFREVRGRALQPTSLEQDSRNLSQPKAKSSFSVAKGSRRKWRSAHPEISSFKRVQKHGFEPHPQFPEEQRPFAIPCLKRGRADPGRKFFRFHKQLQLLVCFSRRSNRDWSKREWANSLEITRRVKLCRLGSESERKPGSWVARLRGPGFRR